MLQHSRKMAESLLQNADLNGAARIREAYERALSRLPRRGRSIGR